MNDVPFLNGLTCGDAAALEAEAQRKLAQSEDCETPLAAAMLNAEATGLQVLARQLREPPAAGLPQLQLGNGGELAPLPDPRMPPALREAADAIHAPPDMLAAQASLNRLSLARDAGVLTEAVDTAESVGTEGAVEQMLAHQIAAAHRVSMQLMAAVNTAPPIPRHDQIAGSCRGVADDANRTALVAARLMDSMTRAALALDRLRHGGRQQVTVQHLVVADGGQAVVAGTIGSGENGRHRRRNGRGRGVK